MKREIYKLFIILFFSSILISCQTTANLVYGTNKSKIYNSRTEYLNENFKKKNIEITKVHFLEKDLFNELANEIISKKLSVYYGISSKYFVSGDQLNIKSCSGQFETLYSKVESEDSDLQKSEVKDNIILQNLNLNPNMKTAIFIYSYKMGRLSNSKIYEVIKELEKNKDFDYRLISLDNVDIKS